MRFVLAAVAASFLAAALAPAHARSEQGGGFHMTLPESGPGTGRILIQGSPYAILEEIRAQSEAKEPAAEQSPVQEAPTTPPARSVAIEPAPMTPAVSGLPLIPASIEGAPSLEQLQQAVPDRNRRGTPAPVYTTLGEAAAAGVDPLKDVVPQPVEATKQAPKAATTTAGGVSTFASFDWKNPKAYAAVLEVVKGDLRIQAGLGALAAVLVLWLLRRRRKAK